jgi:hypothetical protein
MMGEFSDGAVDRRRTRGMAKFPKMELGRREERGLAACHDPAWLAGRVRRGGRAEGSQSGEDCDPACPERSRGEQGQRAEGPCAIPFVFIIECY